MLSPQQLESHLLIYLSCVTYLASDATEMHAPRARMSDMKKAIGKVNSGLAMCAWFVDTRRPVAMRDGTPVPWLQWHTLI